MPNLRWPKPIGSSVLDSLRPVIERSRDVKTNIPKLVEVAQWMAYEELPVPQYAIPFAPDSGNPSQAIDFTLTATTIDFAAETKFHPCFSSSATSFQLAPAVVLCNNPSVVAA